MEENHTTPPQPSPEVSAPKKPFYKQVWFIVVVAVVGVILLALPLLIWLMSMSGGVGGSSSAKDLYYSMIETAAQKTKIRYAYEQIQPAKDDRNGQHVLSLSEYDFTNKKYNTVFISEAIVATAERCVDGVPYHNREIKFPDDYAEALEAINGPSSENKNVVPAQTCDFRKTRSQGHFSDDILPVGLTAAQAKGMADELRLRDTIEIKDEGQVTYQGKKGRKVAFELNPEKTGRPSKPELFFFTLRDGTTGKVGGNGIPLNELNDHRNGDLIGYGAIKGMYIIDEATKLPIYSEVTLSGSSAATYAPSTKWSVYEYPGAFTITPTTPLPTIEKIKS